MRKLLFICLCTLLGNSLVSAQTQIGQDINGEADFDQSGRSVSMSADGSIVAIGATLNDGNGPSSGHVRVYENIAGSWSQIGADIDGEAANDFSGHSISMNADGSIVAIGAFANDGNGGDSGHVRVYKNTAGSWSQIGADIDGEAAVDGSGHSVSISADGSIVAIGAILNDGNGSSSGHVRVYENIAGSWSQIGADIDGEAPGDYSGYAVSMSADGSIVAVGAIRNDGNGSNSGHVRVYENIAGSWSQIGADIDGEASGNYSGRSVSISADGNIVAIGASNNGGNGSNSGHVRVYENIAGSWSQIGADIDGEAAVDNSGQSVSISADGSIVTIGAILNDGNGGDTGHVRVYDLTPADTNSFITTWKTDNLGSSLDNQITIPTGTGTFNYTVDWGDGTTDTTVYTGSTTHTYAATGAYTVKISGDFPHIRFNNGGDINKILSIEQWGTQQWGSMASSFYGCSNLVVNATDVPDLSLVTDMSRMFWGATSFNQDISTWDVSSVIDMSNIFAYASTFNQPIGSWNVSNVTNMDGMFAIASAFNQPIGNWNVSNVANMNGMFLEASAFDQNISSWDVGNVTTMGYMFRGASSFNQDISNWDVSMVTDMNEMFLNAITFNLPLDSWDVSNVTNMRSMFNNARVFNQPIGNWNVGSVTTMSLMFNDARIFNQPIDSWNVSNVTNMQSMFNNATVFNQPIGNWNVGSVTSMGYMFANAFAFNQPIGSWDVSSVTNMTQMFLNAILLNQDIGAWNVGNVTDMSFMFRSASAFDQDLGSWNVSNVTNMSFMFDRITLSLSNYDSILNGWATLSLQSGVSFHGGNSVYCAGAIARQGIIDDYGWTITDGGEYCDTDNDGVSDTDDTCPATPTGETVDANGCSDSQKDSDNDGVSDADDTCSATPTGETVDANGCSDSQKDSDNDGVSDAVDTCPATPTGESVDANGCSDNQKDTDFDGVNDAEDQCSSSPEDEAVDANGCSTSQKDDDNDGVSNDMDECANTSTNEVADANGCSGPQKETDGDGVQDSLDNCPMISNPGQEDRDGDGQGDVCDTVELNASQAFTPNGDGINDTWVISNIENYPNSLVRVYNSWGKEVFSAKNYQNDWDGRYKNLNNKLPNAGSYYFQIDFEGDGKVDQDGWLYITSR